MRPLDGIKVIDIATLVAGPFAAASLAEFGADVIKIEKPGVGDPLRKLGTESPTGDTYWWLSDGRNKKSVELDLRTAEGAETLRQMALDADVIVENFRPGTLDAWGLGYDTLRSENPALIMLSITGFGQDGPKAGLPGLARIAEGLAGFTHLTGEPEGAPLLSGASALSDYVSGIYGAYGVMLALKAREKTGRGQRIDIALFEGILRFLDELAPVYSHTGHTRDRLGSETHRSAPHASFQCADKKWVAIACTNDTLFVRLTRAMGQKALATDPRFVTTAERLKNRVAINAIVEGWTRLHARDMIEEMCAAENVPCGPINNIAETSQDAQVRHRCALTEIDHPDLGRVTVPGVFPRLCDTPGAIHSLGPKLGTDNHLISKPVSKTQSTERT